MVNPQLMISTDECQGELPSNYSTVNLQCAQDVVEFVKQLLQNLGAITSAWQHRSLPYRHFHERCIVFNIAPRSIQNGLLVLGWQ